MEPRADSESESESEDSLTGTESVPDEDEDDDQIIRCKWVGDGSRTLDDLITRLHDFAEYVRGLKRDGWELKRTMDDDYGFLRQNRNAPVVAIEALPEPPKTPRV